MIKTSIFTKIQPQYFVRNFASKLLIGSLFLVSLGMVMTGGLQISQAAQIQQHEWVGDVPIMSELSVEPALGFAFDSPNGRIVMIFASSSASATDIMGFYNKSLAAIGWVGTDGVWRRGSETLAISEVATTAGRLWRLLVRPH
jgi:hypothetical protein